MQVFVSDKKRSKEFGGTEAFSRIKKEMAKEMKGLGPEERILVLGCSSMPQMCVKKDEKDFISFFDKHIYLPLPDYASRLVSLAVFPRTATFSPCIVYFISNQEDFNLSKMRKQQRALKQKLSILLFFMV